MRYSTFIKKLQTKTWYESVVGVAKRSADYPANNPAQIAANLKRVLNHDSDAVGSDTKSIEVHRATITRIRDGVFPARYTPEKGKVDRSRKFDLLELVDKTYPLTKNVFNSFFWDVLRAPPLDKNENLAIKERIFSKYLIIEYIAELKFEVESPKGNPGKTAGQTSNIHSADIDKGVRLILDEALLKIQEKVTNPFEMLALLAVIYRNAWYTMDRSGVFIYIDWVNKIFDSVSKLSWLQESTFNDLKNVYMSAVVDAKGKNEFILINGKLDTSSERVFLYGLKDETYVKNKTRKELARRLVEAIQGR